MEDDWRKKVFQTDESVFEVWITEKKCFIGFASFK